MNWNTKDGWFIDFNPHFPGDPPAGNSPGERVNVDPLLALGVLAVFTNVPTVTGTVACVSGGTSFLYFFDFKTGLPVVGTTAGQPISQMIVGGNENQTVGGGIVINPTCTSGHCGTIQQPQLPPTGVKRFSYRAF